MHLIPREIDKLLLHGVGSLAQKRLARGLRLNHPEAVALIAAQLLEFIREGRNVPELMDLGRRLLGRAEVPPAGEVLPRSGEVVLNEGRPSISVAVTNLGDRPIQVGSHYHFFETNRALSFDRGRAYGMRLDVPAGNAVRFEPGERKSVQLVPLAGAKVARGGNALADGPIEESRRAAAVAAAASRGFAHAEEKP